jgi:hypothetical protein
MPRSGSGYPSSSRLCSSSRLQEGERPFSLARAPAMPTYVPATIALWLAINLFVVLLMGVASNRSPAAEQRSELGGDA